LRALLLAWQWAALRVRSPAVLLAFLRLWSPIL
jgi:hypothetical protein